MVANNAFFASIPPSPALRPASDRATRAAASRQAALHDATLVRRFKAGDDAAFVEIVARYREKMFTIAFTFLRNRADADEIAQDTFIRAHRGLGEFRGDSSLATWLHRITVNLARNRYWHFFRRCQHVTQSLDQPFREENQSTIADVVASDAPGPVREAIQRDFSSLIARCMELLKPHEREILTQRAFLNCSYEEIGVALGIALGTVKSRVARARKNLRALLGDACPEFARDTFTTECFEPVRTRGYWDACA